MFTWKAIYNDGTSTSQYNADGSENRYIDINRLKLVSFQLQDGEKVIYHLFLKMGQRLIYRRRNFIKYTKEGEKRHIVYLVGYQFNDNTGKNYQAINYIYENGLIELDDVRNDIAYLPEEI